MFSEVTPGGRVARASPSAIITGGLGAARPPEVNLRARAFRVIMKSRAGRACSPCVYKTAALCCERRAGLFARQPRRRAIGISARGNLRPRDFSRCEGSRRARLGPLRRALIDRY